MVGGLIGGIAGGATVAIVIKAIDQFSGVFANANKTMLAAGGAITAVGASGAFAVKGLLTLAGQFEQTQIAFTTMLGSAEKAQDLLKELADFAKKTPFELTELETNAKQLLGMGIEVDKLLPTLKSLGDVSAGLSVPLQRIALNFGQIKSQGKLTGRELRDFAVAGVPLLAELAKNLNKTEQEISEMVSRGEIGFQDVENAFTSMTGEGGRFFDLMDAQSATFLGQVSNMKDGLTQIGRTMGEALLPVAIQVVAAMKPFIQFMEEHPKLTQFVAITLALGTALALIVGPLLIITAVLGGPLILAMIAIVGAIALAIVWFDKIKQVVANVAVFILDIWGSVIDFIENSINKMINGVNSLIRQLNRIPGFNLSTIANVDFGDLRGSEIRGRYQSALDQGSGVQVNIENVVGLNPSEISKALSDELNEKVSL